MTVGVIDVHAHVVFMALNGTAGRYGPEAGVNSEGEPFFRIGDYTMKPISYENSVFTDHELRLEELDRLGIERQVLSPNPLTFFHGIDATTAATFCHLHNQLMADFVALRPDRFIGLAALPLQDIPAACDELDHAIGTLGLKGAMVGTDLSQGLACQSLDPSMRSLWRWISRYSFMPAPLTARGNCPTPGSVSIICRSAWVTPRRKRWPSLRCFLGASLTVTQGSISVYHMAAAPSPFSLKKWISWPASTPGSRRA